MPEMRRGTCHACGERVTIDHGSPGAYGHTRSEHDPQCDGTCRHCPVPISCGPVDPDPEDPDPTERLRALLRALETITELAGISGRAGSSRPDSLTEVLVLGLGHLRALIDVKPVIADLLAPQGAERHRWRQALEAAGRRVRHLRSDYVPSQVGHKICGEILAMLHELARHPEAP